MKFSSIFRLKLMPVGVVFNHDYRCCSVRVNRGWPVTSPSVVSPSVVNSGSNHSAEPRRLGGSDL